MDSISKDILIYLMKLLPPRDILALGAACRRFHGLSKDELLWRFLVRRDFGVEPIYGDSALEIYKEEYDCAATNEGIPYLDILYGACEYGQLGDARCALRHGADPGYDSLETFDAAVWSENTELIKLLLDDGRADPAVNNNQPLSRAIESDLIEIVDLLLSDTRVTANITDDFLLFCAIRYERDRIAMLLLQRVHFDLTADDNLAIRFVAENGMRKTLRYLLENTNADPAACNNYAIRYAARRNEFKVVRILLQDRRVDPCAKDNDAFYKAVKRGCSECVELLFRHERVRSTVDVDKAWNMRRWEMVDERIPNLLRPHRKRKRY